MDLNSRQQDAWQFWKQFGDHPVCLAPMVEMGNLAFRTLVRKYNVDICWTGMINSNQWNMSKKYQQASFQTNENDRPLVGQISGSFDADLLSTAESLSAVCDALDINLGCCQKVAKRGNYGYYLVDTENKRQNVLKLVNQISEKINIPLCVKIRMIEDDINLTVNFAKELEKAGAKIITIHARSAQQDKKGEANITSIKEIVNAVKIPVIANGGINSKEMSKKVLDESGAAGIMVGQALLNNPALFSENSGISRFQIAREFLEIAKKVNCPLDTTRRHMFYMFDEFLGNYNEYRRNLSCSNSFDEVENFISFLESKVENK
ncbi:tRNA-dihydrouridine(20a/20b) synthase [NAD(P)+]-like protein [Tritrichomonas foetus]|uniref:tRNA-dihydrouridine synthase n=1 Tax=Tritrichomonas foetus TaxID=1144522 RepID=A0A1J4KW03_9EUKA|nr:tRNA-dihydrouridine(20a/20b) synthase [NAD(P)+]-like protein [Tritrichomonas foetus]|eukprot:OHT13878.1 tRNA-dihydrouridine(20a/20b) synthase [NAD(P)+]-like protein [Tritrichomonas foetus]